MKKLNIDARAVFEMFRIAKIALTIVYALACSAAILLLSGQDYEWMIGERAPDGSALTRCTIPPATDDVSDIAAPVALIFIAVLFAPGLFCLIRRRRMSLSLALSLGLLALWGYRFLGRAAFC